MQLVTITHISYMIIDACSLSGNHFGQRNRSVLLSNVRCEPERDTTILECCNRNPDMGSNSRYCCFPSGFVHFAVHGADLSDTKKNGKESAYNSYTYKVGLCSMY